MSAAVREWSCWKCERDERTPGRSGRRQPCRGTFSGIPEHRPGRKRKMRRAAEFRACLNPRRREPSGGTSPTSADKNRFRPLFAFMTFPDKDLIPRCGQRINSRRLSLPRTSCRTPPFANNGSETADSKSTPNGFRSRGLQRCNGVRERLQRCNGSTADVYIYIWKLRSINYMHPWVICNVGKKQLTILRIRSVYTQPDGPK